ncbi:unnamed protein product [Zymoseptoria tritici ST99CH_1E4]|uniref:HECT-type E3 ubiquitin transferase n=1 Tax=Zymoseptoria tritici ST99CH_1E4 TaxID=1276532 RepID=A0A2H1G3U1_ZYMTR|nr:unnamed protein product [Zymoseptoria tritici ST99CH_1E4]
MHQQFTGKSRPKRQVNLSGRSSNPFASSTTSASGAQSAVASAQQERLQRQQQRDRLQASSRIQRTWRGHNARRKTFRLWREIWDQQEQRVSGGYDTADDSLRQLNRLLLFFGPKSEPSDVSRLAWYGTRQVTTSETITCSGGPWPRAYCRLQEACIAAIKARNQADAESDRTILGILAYAARQTTFTTEQAIEYYETLTSAKDLPTEQLQGALLAPLGQSKEAYSGLVLLLARPLDPDMLGLLRAAVDPQSLSDAVAGLGTQTSRSTRDRLWMLGNIICLAGQTNNLSFMAAVARLLGSLADEVDFEGQPLDLNNASYDNEVLSKIPTGSPLNTFLHQQMTSLLDRHAIQNLLSGSRIFNGGDHTQILAGYALTLLRCFPRRADDTRMWLHLGPNSADSVSPTRYLWEATQRSQIFGDIRSNSRSVVSILKTSRPTSQQKDDWTIILVFLEMFTFDLKIMDDEEFMGDHPDVKKNSAVPVEDIAVLVTFLKNLGFTLYFDAAELNNSTSVPTRDDTPASFSRRFGAVNSSNQTPAEANALTVGGLSGLTIDYLKGLVTGLLRAVYERDSRRKFLPKDHWLMIDRFDMTTFIPGVVAEEESRHQVQEQDDEDKDEESDDDVELINDIGRGGSGGYARARLLRSQEARARAQRKASRKRYLESVAPRLEILQNMPFFIPFHTRVQIFRQFVHLDQEKRRHGFVDPDMWRERMMFQPNSMPALARHHAKIKRTQEFQDAYEQFYELGADLKEPIQITFVDQWDMPEAGIDGGGVTKEFLTSVISQAFDPDANNMEQFFVENDQHLLHPNPTAFETLKYRLVSAGHRPDSDEVRTQIRELYRQYEFLGRIIGKCLYEGILVDVSFAGFFLKKWALTGGTGSAPSESHYRANINDLRELDESLYKGLLQVKYASDASDLGMTFSVNDIVTSSPSSKPHVLEVDLIPNGANTPVTNENRLLYINALSRYRLQTQSTAQTRAFLRGLGDMIQPSWLSMFNQSELQTLIGGASAGIDVQDLRRNTLYGGTYVIGTDGLEHPSIQHFWRVMETFPDEDRRKVLKFVTSTPRGPLLGFGHLNPRFSIRDSGRDENRFPTTSTCVNLLKLPMYGSEERLRRMLLAAVNSGAGFDLS